MNIIRDFPPNYSEIIKVFPIVPTIKTIVFTYGDAVYKPYKKGTLTDHVKVHEKTHEKQQGNDPAGWWNKYLSDPKFRLDQEVEAYRNQYRFFVNKNYNFKERAKLLDGIAGDLASDMYGGIISKNEAIELIRKGGD
jgi:hypothetical protein